LQAKQPLAKLDTSIAKCWMQWSEYTRKQQHTPGPQAGCRATPWLMKEPKNGVIIPKTQKMGNIARD